MVPKHELKRKLPKSQIHPRRQHSHAHHTMELERGSALFVAKPRGFRPVRTVESSRVAREEATPIILGPVGN